MNVFHLNMIHLLTESVQSYDAFISRMKFLLLEDLQNQYAEKSFSAAKDIPDLLSQTGEAFVFVIDEWDAVFEMPFMSADDKRRYLLFLKALLKDKSYVHFVYMTGILPAATYTGGSTLNMFREFSVFKDDCFYSCFGLSREEIEELIKNKGFTHPSIEELTFWYDGYIRAHDGVHMFNPESVACAFADGKCESNWTGTGPVNEIRDILVRNVQVLQEEISFG